MEVAQVKLTSEEVVAKLIKATKTEKNKKPTLKTSQLKTDWEYHITQIRATNTTFGPRVVVELGGKEEYFLPERFMSEFPGLFNPVRPDEAYMIYKGIDPSNNSIMLRIVNKIPIDDDYDV